MAVLKPHPPWILDLAKRIAVPSHIGNHWPLISEWKVTIDRKKGLVTWEEFEDIEDTLNYHLDAESLYDQKRRILGELEELLDKKIVKLEKKYND